MKRLKTMQELVDYLLEINAPAELKKAAKEGIKAVEESNRGGAQSYLVIARTKAGAAKVKLEYDLTSRCPESDVSIFTENGEVWREQVFVFSDDGSGIIYYQRIPLLP